MYLFIHQKQKQMKKNTTIQIQVVENSDRFHVSVDGFPEATYLYGPLCQRQSREETLAIANKALSHIATQYLNTGNYTVKLLPMEKK